MELVIRGAAIYLVLLIVFRLAGTRALAQITTFDFVLLLVIGEVTQQGLLGEDFSVTGALILILTLVMLEVGMSLLQVRFRWLDKLVDGVPVVILEHGRPIEDRLRRSRLTEQEILEAARELQGIERLDQIKYAVLERHGGITVIPAEGHTAS